MRRSTSIVVAVVAAAAMTAVVSRPSVVNALAGLAGRTHVIVTEDNLKTLSVEGTVSAGSPLAISLSERNRDGSLGATYVIPAGRVFVVTDVRVDAVPGQRNSHEFFTRLTGPGGDRWNFWWENQDNLDIVERSFTGGIPYDAGSTVDFLTTTSAGIGFLVRFDVLGYETEARP